MRKELFDPSDITQDEMDFIADHIENFINNLEEIMIIPDDIKRDCEDEIEEGIERSKKLIKKLRKGKRSVFNDDFEFNLS